MSQSAATMRAVRALTVGSVVAFDRRRRRDDDEKLQELDQQFQLPIAGAATAIPVWQEIEVTFELALLDAPDMRETPYSDPLVTYGVVCAADVFISLNVAEWKRDDQGDVIGALVRIGAVAPGSAEYVLFRGEVHVNFQGFGAPDFTDDTED